VVPPEKEEKAEAKDPERRETPSDTGNLLPLVLWNGGVGRLS